MNHASDGSLLQVDELTVTFPTDSGDLRAVRGISFHVDAREVVAIVGESGSGKSAAAMAIMGLVPEYARVTGSVRLDGTELLGLSDAAMSEIRGRRIGMVFQDPMSALTPVYTIGDQIAEAITVHRPSTSRRAARQRAVEPWSSSVSRRPNGVHALSRMNCPEANVSGWSSRLR